MQHDFMIKSIRLCNINSILCPGYRETQVIYQQVAAWMVKMESNLMNNATLPDELNGRCLLFVQVRRVQ